jgi:hypothetical protein
MESAVSSRFGSGPPGYSTELYPKPSIVQTGECVGDFAPIDHKVHSCFRGLAAIEGQNCKRLSKGKGPGCSGWHGMGYVWHAIRTLIVLNFHLCGDLLDKQNSRMLHRLRRLPFWRFESFHSAHQPVLPYPVQRPFVHDSDQTSCSRYPPV